MPSWPRSRHRLDRLLAGASAEDIAVLEASVAQAQAGLDRAKAARQQAEISAPFDGTISDVLIRDGTVRERRTADRVVG